jgi:hypothetical protein
MKKVLVGLLFATNVFALDYVGPPRAELKKGGVSMGFNYCYSREDVEFRGELFGWPTKATFEDVESNRYYGNMTLAPVDYLNIFVRLGAADVDYDDLNFDASPDPYWGYGIKATFYEQGALSIGGVGQMNWISVDDTGIDPIFGTLETEYDAYEIQIAIGPTLDMGGWFLYGGPFYYILEGDFETKDILGTVLLSGDINEDSQWGGFLGAQLPMGANFAIGIDSTIMTNGYSVSGSVALKF